MAVVEEVRSLWEKCESLGRDVLQEMPCLTVSEACDENARRWGRREALCDGRQRLTWRDLKTVSDRLAFGLYSLGLERNDTVLVQLPNVAELFLLRLACEKGGFPLVLVPPTFRQAELRAIISRTRPVAAVVPASWRGHDFPHFWRALREEIGLPRHLVFWDGAPAGELDLSDLERMGEASSTGEGFLERVRFRLFERSHIATTSGSTGLPKCVEVPAYVRPLTGLKQAERFGVRQGDTLAACTSIVSGAAESLVYGAGPFYGCRLVLLEHFTPVEMRRLLDAEEVQGATVVPTMLVRLLRENPAPFRSVRFLASYGAPLPFPLGVEAEERLGCRIVQAYGSVDFGGISATWVEAPREARIGTVGEPLPGNEVVVVDADGQHLPRGKVGRLFVRGLHAVGGYLGGAALTRETWRSGFCAVGELGYLDSEGRIVLTGRERDIILRGGQTIYPADIEEVLAQHPAVAEAVVIGVPDAEMGERVCACVSLRPGYRLNLVEVVEFLSERGLAAFKYPERLCVFDELPRVPTGLKVDRNELRRRVMEESATG